MTSLLAALAMLLPPPADPQPFNPALSAYVNARVAEFDQIPAERRRQLTELANCLRDRAAAGQPVRLTFICTHNSRRSQFAQVWAAAAAAHYGLPVVESFSGGTEATAFNPRAVAALQRAGFAIARDDTAQRAVAPLSGSDNPRYLVRFHDDAPPLACFSKIYSAAGNPQTDFCAVMTCSQADQNCPQVAGAAHRVALPYDDPRTADGTEQESATYDARCRQIAREILFVFSQANPRTERAG